MRSWADALVEKCEVVIPHCKQVQHINANAQFVLFPIPAILTSVVVSDRFELPSIDGAHVMYRREHSPSEVPLYRFIDPKAARPLTAQKLPLHMIKDEDRLGFQPK
jgi:hypothetical protein